MINPDLSTAPTVPCPFVTRLHWWPIRAHFQVDSFPVSNRVIFVRIHFQGTRVLCWTFQLRLRQPHLIVGIIHRTRPYLRVWYFEFISSSRRISNGTCTLELKLRVGCPRLVDFESEVQNYFVKFSEFG